MGACCDLFITSFLPHFVILLTSPGDTLPMSRHSPQDKEQIALLQGKAYQDALNMMKDTVQSHKSYENNDMIVTLACEEAEGLYVPASSEELKWKIPASKSNLHVEIIVQDTLDRRFIPNLDITLRIIDSNKSKDTYKLPFLWHPFLFHYGKNIEIPGEGKYSFEVMIKQPTFGRHDEIRGNRYAQDTSIQFDDLYLKPGRKEHGPE